LNKSGVEKYVYFYRHVAVDFRNGER